MLPVTWIRLPSRCLSAPARFLNCIERPPVSTTTGESLNKALSSSRFCHPRKMCFRRDPEHRPPFQREFSSEPAMDSQSLLAVSSATHRPVADKTLCPRRVPQPQNTARPFPKAQSTGDWLEPFQRMALFCDIARSRQFSLEFCGCFRIWDALAYSAVASQTALCPRIRVRHHDNQRGYCCEEVP